MEPKLALSYNSRGGPSPFGVGWALTGYSVIQRGPRNLRDDGIVRGVQLDRDDAFFLDGEKLVLIARTTTTAEYRTRIDTYARVRAELDASGNPTTFVVDTKAGSQMRFGSTDNSRSTLSNKVVTTWLLDTVEDKLTNFMALRYQHDGLDYHLAEILYTGNRNARRAPTAKVTIRYEQGEAYSTRYVIGDKVDQRMRAIAIDVSGIRLGKEISFRRYELRQGNADEGDKRKVRQLQELAEHAQYGPTPLAFRPTAFKYSKAEPTWQASDLLSSVPDLPDGPDLSQHYRLLHLDSKVPGS